MERKTAECEVYLGSRTGKTWRLTGSACASGMTPALLLHLSQTQCSDVATTSRSQTGFRKEDDRQFLIFHGYGSSDQAPKHLSKIPYSVTRNVSLRCPRYHSPQPSEDPQSSLCPPVHSYTHYHFLCIK